MSDSVTSLTAACQHFPVLHYRLEFAQIHVCWCYIDFIELLPSWKDRSLSSEKYTFASRTLDAFVCTTILETFQSLVHCHDIHLFSYWHCVVETQWLKTTFKKFSHQLGVSWFRLSLAGLGVNLQAVSKSALYVSHFLFS